LCVSETVMVSMQRILAPFMMCALIFNGGGCNKKKEETDDKEDTETDDKEPQPQPQTDDKKPQTDDKNKNKNKEPQKECTVPKEGPESILDDSVELEKCKAGDKIKQGETCSFKCKSEHDEKNKGKVSCRKDGTFYSTAKCTKSPFSEKVLDAKLLFEKRLKYIQEVAEEAAKSQNDQKKDSKDANCTGKKALYEPTCWVEGSRCKKIIKAFENASICYLPPGNFPNIQVGSVIKDENDFISASCEGAIEELERIKKNIKRGVQNMKSPGANNERSTKLIAELNDKRDKTIRALAKLSESMQFLPWTIAGYPSKADWLNDAVDKKKFRKPELKFRSNLEARTSVFGPYESDPAGMSTWLSKNCAPPVEQILGGLKGIVINVFREVEEDAPQKPSHIVLSA